MIIPEENTHRGEFIIDEDTYLKHYGILRKSGRYPWGSGGNAEQRSLSFLGMIESLKAKGLSQSEIAAGFNTPDTPFNSTDLRDTITIARNEAKAANVARAEMYKAKSYSNIKIGEKMGLNESSVRALLAPGALDRRNRLVNTVDMLRRQVEEKGMIDVGKGVALQLDMAENRLSTAVAVLKAEGYEVHKVQSPQVGRGRDSQTIIKVLAPQGTTYKDIVQDRGQIKSLAEYSDDGGYSFSKIKPPLSVDSKRVSVNYKEDGGDKADGVIYVRPGVKDLDMGASNYAQVRIMVDGTHYIKGMAMFKDDLPDGVDLVFNTNKSDKGDKLKALKPLARLKADGDPDDASQYTGPVDQQNPFGSIVRQIGDRDEAGRVTKVTSALNLVNEEGDWNDWSNTLSAQMLSKQKISLIRERLNESYAHRKEGLDEIMALTNPAIKKKLLESYADDLDSAAVHLKAAGMPRQKTQVILPLNTIKPNEVYAPNFNDGERVVLIRYPHGGKFEIPELTVNNRHRPAKAALKNAKDAIGIHHTVAERLSGADFDGDTVVVIPNNHGKITTESALKGLAGFDHQNQYKGYEGMPKLAPEYKNKLMGEVSNLITDMTIKGANNHEIAQAVRHSMVVIDAEKHNLNYRQSAIDNNIPSLKQKYQANTDGRVGASTLISRKKSPLRVDERRLRKASEGGSVDPVTGKKVWIETGREYTDKRTGKVVRGKSTVDALAYVDDARELSSGTVQEKLYSDYSNRMRDLANKTRLSAMSTGKTDHHPSAARVYEKEVASLDASLKTALQNKPRERQAHVIANAQIKQVTDSNPGMDKAEVKKMEYLILEEARARVGAKKEPVTISDKEWEAIQAGALRPTKLNEILNNTDLNRVKELATPRPKLLMTPAKEAKAARLLDSGATQSEVARQLGVSLTTLTNYLNGGS